MYGELATTVNFIALATIKGIIVRDIAATYRNIKGTLMQI